ncbi:hypothetical protein B0H19DRAFT_1086462 [Mycena capillaripes]|nr:hypothetical protein B0H19DRAFT_1086462 [Mycena capillaripes]
MQGTIESTTPTGSSNLRQYNYQETITNSPFVRGLPWTTAGIADDTWRGWEDHNFEVPEYFQFGNLLSEIKDYTNTYLAPYGSTAQQFARWFCGYTTDNPMGTNKSKWVLPNNSFFALRVLDFLASHILNAPPSKRDHHARGSLDPIGTGKIKEVMDAMADWRTLMRNAGDILQKKGQQRTMNVLLETNGLDVSPRDRAVLQQVALYNNLIANFKKDGYDHILTNFRLTAFILGWFFQGKFQIPKTDAELLAHLSGHGFADQVANDKAELQQALKGTGLLRLQNPCKLFLFVSPLTLLVPSPLATWAFTDIFAWLGLEEKPADIEACEKLLRDEIISLALGIKTAEKALVDFMLNVSFALVALGNVVARFPDNVTTEIPNDDGRDQASTPSLPTLNVEEDDQTQHGHKPTPPLTTLNVGEDQIQRHHHNLSAADKATIRDNQNAAHDLGSALNDVFMNNDNFSDDDEASAKEDQEADGGSAKGDQTDTGSIPYALDNALVVNFGSDKPLSTDEDYWSGFSDFEGGMDGVDSLLDAGSNAVESSSSSFMDELTFDFGSPMPTFSHLNSLTPPIIPALPMLTVDPSLITLNNMCYQDLEAAKKILRSAADMTQPRLIDDVVQLGKRTREMPPVSYAGNPATFSRKRRRPAVKSTLESDQEDARSELQHDDTNIPVAKSTELWQLEVAKFQEKSKKAPLRATHHVVIFCYRPAKSDGMTQHWYRALCFETTQQKKQLKSAKQDDSDIALAIQATFIADPQNQASYPQSLPKHWSMEARNPEFIHGSSKYFITDCKAWSSYPALLQQIIFEYRHIVIKRKPSDRILQLDIDTMDLMGIPLDRVLKMQDMALRTAVEPLKCAVTTTMRKFLEAGSENGRVLNVTFPMHLTSFPDPEGFVHLNTSEAAFTHTQTLTGCQDFGSSPLLHATKWGMATCAGASTLVCHNRLATMTVVKCGGRMLYCADGPLDTIHSLDDWGPTESCTPRLSYEGIFLTAGDIFNEAKAEFSIKRPNTISYELTTESSLIWGRDFIAKATMLDHIWGHIHACLLEKTPTNSVHEDASLFFIQIQAYWFVNLKLVYEGKILGSYTRAHIPDIQTWPGFLRMLCLGNFILFLEALDYRTYVDLSQLPDTEKECRSVVHLAAALAFYKSGYSMKVKGWTQSAFRAKLLDTLQNYAKQVSDHSLISSYQTLLAQGEPPAAGNFLPVDWVGGAFSVELKRI